MCLGQSATMDERLKRMTTRRREKESDYNKKKAYLLRQGEAMTLYYQQPLSVSSDFCVLVVATQDTGGTESLSSYTRHLRLGNTMHHNSGCTSFFAIVRCRRGPNLSIFFSYRRVNLIK